MFAPLVYGMAAAEESAGIGAAGSEADEVPASTALFSSAPVDGPAVSSARNVSAGNNKTATAAMAIIRPLVFILVSCTARRDGRQAHRRIDSTRIGNTRYCTDSVDRFHLKSC